ncbi:L-arabinose-responsive transcription regulator ARA1 [Hyphodiscus hymeniophilus]|uniref:L-arabinose-responsive transcription regulator ARA1 n=1 Tax=Hyphodiscus hymeniophilus TaxID=353542 RepID=A0A9P6SQH4_9HELO|nr:L-arabinose-responsive transcription regulator ARA1 [Hyphodiscus hymeniophilus]
MSFNSKHLVAAKVFCAQAKEFPTGGHTTYFLTTWLAYHQVLADFSYTPELHKHLKTTPQLPILDLQNRVIIGSLGCSMQVLQCISCVNQLTHTILQSPCGTIPAEFASIPQVLQIQLENLQQISGVVEDTASGRVDEARIINTAELYRLATLIYLHRSVLTTPSDSGIMKDLVSRSLHIIEEIGVCTSPWPIFMAACEVIGDDQRVRILDAVDKMQKERRIGNVEIMRNIIETVWKQVDLHPCPQGQMRVDWKSLVNMERQIPSFI